MSWELLAVLAVVVHVVVWVAVWRGYRADTRGLVEAADVVAEVLEARAAAGDRRAA